MEQWLILELKEKIYRISLGYFSVLESKKRLKTNKNTYIHNDEGLSKGYRNQFKELPTAKVG